jgi:diguanylate cyclase (GGDEF)-like protein
MGTYKLFVCDNYAREFAWAIREGGLEDLDVVAFPCMCQDKKAKAITQELLRTSQCGGEEGCIICGKHCDILTVLPADNRLAVRSSDFCATPLAGEGLLSYLAQRGGYLLTLGWLKHWQERLAAQGFDQQTARSFFGDFCKELVFLDAGIEPQAEEMLQAMSQYLGLPYVVVPLQQETLLVLLRSLLCTWQLHSCNSDNRAKVSVLQASAAEYAAILDVMGKIAMAKTKREAIDKIKDIFTMVLGAGQFRFWDSEYSSAEIPVQTRLFFGETVRTYILDKTQGTFTVKIQSQDRVFGAAEVGQFLFPDQIDRYLNFAVAVAPVCGLALANIENYEKLLQSEQDLQYLSFHDELTGLKNRNFLATLLETEHTAAGSSVFMMDLDGLKRVNDNYGHLEGDLLILGAAQMLRESFRETDVVARIGGDEFVVIARGCDKACADMLAARLTDKIAQHNQANTRDYLNLSLSMGHTQTPAEGESLEVAMRRADELMYQDKRSKV